MYLNFRIAVNETLENVISSINHEYILQKRTERTYIMLWNIVEIYSNEDYDETFSSKNDEDDFLYYKTYIDFYPINEVKIDLQINLAKDIKRLFNNLSWKAEIIADLDDKVNI